MLGLLFLLHSLAGTLTRSFAICKTSGESGINRQFQSGFIDSNPARIGRL
nr:MAG TPA: hypothetical protein [Bacteriophage sp.]